ncbi:MAG: pyruvate formate lyase-activating protein, partial [Clostridia bacterium]|nr:pyruvate formate lyase-activating protein [Clostridia bacterium]
MYNKSVLAIDVGGGTQDILLYEPDKNIENCTKLVLPSPTVLVRNQINNATQDGKDIFLTGPVMGGGPSVRGV